MTTRLRSRAGVLLAGCLLLTPAGSRAYGAMAPQGGEFGPAGAILGDQIHARVGIAPSGGYVVWQDNVTDGDGLGVSARRLDSTLTGTLNTFRVNSNRAGDQENPAVAMLPDGGAVFAWQGGVAGAQRIYARFLKPDGTFHAGDIKVNTYSQGYQCTPAVGALEDGQVAMVWASYGQDGSLLGVYGQRLSNTGEKLGGEFHVCQSTENNQRYPAVVALPGGRFLVTWVSERFVGYANATAPPNAAGDRAPGGTLFEVDVFGRIFAANGSPEGDEFRISAQGDHVCAYPVARLASDGRLLVAWSGRRNRVQVGGPRPTDGWDIFGRLFKPDLSPEGPPFRINSEDFGDQYVPRLGVSDRDFVAVWTSLAQDGSREGIFARRISPDGPVGQDTQVNATAASQQITPDVATDGEGRMLVVWSSFVGGPESLELYGQRYAATATLPAPAPPIVAALNSYELSVTWPIMSGFDVAEYEVYADDATAPVTVEANSWTAGPFLPGSLHTFRLAFKLANGQRSPLSTATTGRTWGMDANFDGLPDDWQGLFWDSGDAVWPPADADSDGDGATNREEFLSGTDPVDSASVLKMALVPLAQAWQLTWNTQPGFLYQVQFSIDATTWANVGSRRFATDTTDAIAVDGSASLAMFRVIRIR